MGRDGGVAQGPDMDDDPVDVLLTVRDWLRYGVTRFNAAGLAYGHGTANALDEAAFLILETLRLPIDQLEPWFDARLTRSERAALRDIIDARIETRKPAPYLTKSAYIRGRRFFVDERVIVPRSYIGELLDEGLDGVVPHFGEVADVLDLCTGGGSLAVLAAEAFPAAHVDAVDISASAHEVADCNVRDYGLAERIAIVHSDLFAALEGKRYDLILSNPPYVTAESVAAFPLEHRAEPQLAHLGGCDGLDLVRRILTGAGDHLNPDGVLIVEIGQARPALEAAYPDLPFLWLDTAESEGEVFALNAADLRVQSPGEENGARKRKLGAEAPKANARPSRSKSPRTAR